MFFPRYTSVTPAVFTKCKEPSILRADDTDNLLREGHRGLLLPLHSFSASTCSAILPSQQGLLCFWTGRSQIGRRSLDNLNQRCIRATSRKLSWFWRDFLNQTAHILGRALELSLLKIDCKVSVSEKQGRTEFLWVTNWNESRTSRDGYYLTNMKIETGKLVVRKYI